MGTEIKKYHILPELLVTFMNIGLFTFGGGYAMIPLIENSCVEKKQWITHDDMMNITVIAESTPGPIAINCATFVGYRQAGFAGALAATLGIIIPSFIIIFLISIFWDRFLEIKLVADAFQGIRIAVGILILDAARNMIKKMYRKSLSRIIMAGSFAVMLLIQFFSWNFSSISLMVTAALVNLSVFCIKDAAQGRQGGNR